MSHAGGGHLAAAEIIIRTGHLYQEGGMVTHDEPQAPAGINTKVPSPARVYDYWLGGKDNFAVDRVAAEAFMEAFPGIVNGVRANRAFLGRAVNYLATEAGVRQFLDIGTGLPTANNTHEVAQRAAPDSRVVYVDNDPVVLLHAAALMTSTPEGKCDYIQADLEEPDKILEGAAKTLDYSLPVAVSLLQILQFIPNENDPWGLVRTIMDALPSGSYLVVTQPTGDVITATITEAIDRYNEHLIESPVHLRTTEEIRRFFDGLELIDPGLVQLHRWRPGVGVDASAYEIPALAGVGRKP
jgi:O-methyltransferase involved in polyketide biosynthesis